jgi:tripartite-type tricarboxylate transporter receptor subunit TctC
VNEKAGLDYAPEALTFEKTGYDIENATSLMVYGPRGLLRPVAEKLEKAFIEASRVEPFLGVARKNELITDEPITGPALADSLRKISANYEQLIRDAGLYKSEKK